MEDKENAVDKEMIDIIRKIALLPIPIGLINCGWFISRGEILYGVLALVICLIISVISQFLISEICRRKAPI